MFAIARAVVRHKVSVVALIAIGAFFLMPEEEEAPVSNNPWAVQPETTTLAKADEGGMVDDLMTEATDFLDENGINPSAVSDETVGRLDDAATSFSNANK